MLSYDQHNSCNNKKCSVIHHGGVIAIILATYLQPHYYVLTQPSMKINMPSELFYSYIVDKCTGCLVNWLPTSPHWEA